MDITKENAVEISKAMIDEIRPILAKYSAMGKGTSLHIRTPHLHAFAQDITDCTPDCMVTESIEGPPGVFHTVTHCAC